MKSLMFTILLAGLIVLTGCSNKELYDNLQSDRKSSCEKLPETERADCILEHEQSYNEYKKDQEELDKN